MKKKQGKNELFFNAYEFEFGRRFGDGLQAMEKQTKIISSGKSGGGFGGKVKSRLLSRSYTSQVAGAPGVDSGVRTERRRGFLSRLLSRSYSGHAAGDTGLVSGMRTERRCKFLSRLGSRSYTRQVAGAPGVVSGWRTERIRWEMGL